MPKIPTDNFAFWLFPENLLPEGNTFEFCEFVPEYKTRKGLKIPVFVLLGSDKERQGEFLLATWNIENLKELIVKLGENSDTWKTPKFTATAKDKKVVLRLLE